MLESVPVGTQGIDGYRSSAGDDAIEAVRSLAAPLQGARVLHVNATPYGGGVAEILRSFIPLLRDLGLVADWKLITGDDEFFATTKTMHNALQGATRGLTSTEEAEYLSHSEHNAQLLEEDYDLVVVHDPQPLPLPELHGRRGARWIWRCHIDTSEPNDGTWAFVRPFLAAYDSAVFTLGGFVPPDVPISRVEIIPPAIDPNSPKNLELGPELSDAVVQWLGVDVDRPMMVQVSRFDPWKDPFGVIEAYRRVKQEVPALQLVLAGSMALDDPEGWGIYHRIGEAARSDPDLYLFTNLTGVGNIEVNALQRIADVVVQKSIREGFGLVVSETLWKGTPVVGGRVGGIPLQLRDGTGGYLVESTEECAARVVQLLDDPELARRLGESGRALVRERFLLTRLLADELQLYASVLGTTTVRPTRANAGLAGERRDPVCGMRLDDGASRSLTFAGQPYPFCSRSCEEEFARDPGRFLRGVSAAS